MILDLDHRDLISLVMGRTPSYTTMGLTKMKDLGEYYDQYGKWTWNTSALTSLSDERLLDIYMILKNQ